MTKAVINTHAGDDSDGKLWGIEGVNILFILAGLLFSVGLSLMLFRQQAHSVRSASASVRSPSSSPAFRASLVNHFRKDPHAP
jgi:hypothetical protein